MSLNSHLDKLMTQGVALHQSGDLQQAAVGYRTALKSAKKNAGVLHLPGALLHQKGNNKKVLNDINQTEASTKG